jgi:hypothetical protein
MAYTWGSIIVIVMVVAAVPVVVGAGTVQSVEGLEYELVDQRTAIHSHRPIPALELTEYWQFHQYLSNK